MMNDFLSVFHFIIMTKKNNCAFLAILYAPGIASKNGQHVYNSNTSNSTAAGLTFENPCVKKKKIR